MTAKLSPRKYDLLLTRSQKFALLMPIVMFLIIPVIFFGIFSMSEAAGAGLEAEPFFPWFPFALFLGFAVFYGWTVATLPYRITTTIDQQIHFKSLLNVRTVRVSEIVKIEPRGLRIQAGISGYDLHHRNGRIRFPGQFTGMYLLLAELKGANPALEILGC
jgi:hypothetical protein